MPTREIDELGVFVHGVLVGLHALGVAYNLRRRNWFAVTMHLSGVVYDSSAAVQHARRLR